jgi:hypothetical protein
MSKERYEYIVKAFIDMKDALAAEEIEVSDETAATLIAVDELHSLYCSVEYRGI